VCFYGVSFGNSGTGLLRKPLHPKEIAERIIEAGLWVAKGKTLERQYSKPDRSTGAR